MRPEANWCGPRVVYFFARYLGTPCNLEGVVAECRTNSDGNTMLINLVHACENLRLDPLAIRCDAKQMLALGGPAIITVKTGRNDGAVHFVGLVRPEGTDYWVVDPSVSTRAIVVNAEQISSAFAGTTVLLKGCRRPWFCSTWVRIPATLLPPFLAFALVLSVFRKHAVRKRRGMDNP
jgi:ABC-type bacteriocin/lantibiotic exporter with double-glycine peptidase domain